MNYTKLKIASVCAIWLCSANILHAKEWRGIVPLKSTRADVEKVMGKPNDLRRYEFENERAYITYSSGCNRIDDCRCLAPRDTVVDIYVTVEVEMKFSDLKIDRTKYHKTKSTHLPGIVTYANDSEGIIYTVDDEDDEVTHITYLPTAKDCQSLIKDQPLNKRRSSRLRRNLDCPWLTIRTTTTTTRQCFRARLPRNPGPLTGAQVDKLGSNLQKFLDDPECGTVSVSKGKRQ